MQSRTPVSQDEERLLQRIGDLNDQVRRLESEMERTHRLATLGLLAGSIAHEFNNILTPVLSYAQLALASPEDQEMTRKALRKAVEGTEKAAQIASAMLGFVREDAQPAVSSVRQVVDDALRCLGRDLSKEGIAVDIQVPRDCKVAMRPVALEQVLMNLILNAVEAMKPSVGRLRIAATNCSTWNTPGTGVAIEVEDSGRGIPEEMISKVFEPFVSERHAGSGKQGTGLGLSICKRLVEEAGGTIEAQSRVGEGTLFRVRLSAV